MIAGMPPRRDRPRVAIATPATAEANNGNWRTAERWAGFLVGGGGCEVSLHAGDDPGPLADADALIALHAVKSRVAIDRFRADRAGAPLAIVLTGTDVYGADGTAARGGEAWRHAAESASALVVLQPATLARLDAGLRAKARVIVQSATPLQAAAARDDAEVVAVGHLRAVKDPRTLWRAARRLAQHPDNPPPFRIDHIGAALEPALADEARATEAACGGAFRWRGGLDHVATRRAIAAAQLLVHPSLAEGGAHAVIEAVVSGTAVIASRIEGNTGLLGDDHDGLFPPGDDAALAALLGRFFAEPAFAARLGAQGAALVPRFAPDAERTAVRALAHDLLAGFERGSPRRPERR
jgi:putative glycosyltransferase (TIGR04348 family)